MNDILEFDEKKKTIKSLNLDDFSEEDLNEYIETLELEIKRALEEVKKKQRLKKEALKFFE